MIKLLWFAVDESMLGPWMSPRSAVDPKAAPLRVTRNLVLRDEQPAGAPHGVIDVAHFEDHPHLERFRRTADADEISDHVQVVTEVVLRGEDWLTGRWSAGGPRYKHMALARRADGLSPAEFAERWQAHAGTAGATTIPDEMRGQAYAQNHPAPDADRVIYDAVNEVWFDDLDLLRARHRWLTETVGSTSDDDSTDDLFGERHLLIVEEQVLEIS